MPWRSAAQEAAESTVLDVANSVEPLDVLDELVGAFGCGVGERVPCQRRIGTASATFETGRCRDRAGHATSGARQSRAAGLIQQFLRGHTSRARLRQHAFRQEAEMTADTVANG